MQFLSKFLRGFGIVAILIFCSGSIWIGSWVREIGNEQQRKAFSYTSIFDNVFYDYRMRKSLDPYQKINNIVLAKVDDLSLKKIGRFPWSRDVWAKLIGRLKNYGAKVLAFDVLYSEPEKMCGPVSNDDLLAASFKDFQSIEGNKILLSYGSEPYEIEDQVYKEMPEELFNFILDSKQESESAALAQYWVLSTTYPIKKLRDTNPLMGYISNVEDSDGVFRYYPLVNNVSGLYLPSFGLQAFTSFTGKAVSLQVAQNSQSATFKIDDKPALKLNSRGETKIRWIGEVGNFAQVSLLDIWEREDDPEIRKMLAGNLIFIGSTAVGAHDLRNTAISSKLPGVYAHMNMTYMLMNNFFYQSDEQSINTSLIILGVGSLIMILVQLLSNPVLDLFTLIGLLAGAYLLDTQFLIGNGYEIKLFFIFLSYVSIYSWNTFLNFSRSNEEKKMIKGTFARFVAPTVVDEMLQDPSKVKIGGQRKDITCMFSDVRDFTSISEKLDAQQLSHALNQYMTKMTNIVFDTDGTVDKYIGDAIVALWGAPVDVGNHADKAVTAAIRMIELMPIVNEEFAKQGLPEFKYGIGLNSGECSVGNMGSDKIFSYTALGDNMNLGARLEGLCKPYGSMITISEFTKARLDENKYLIRKLDRVRVKGKEQPVEIFEVLTTLHPFFSDRVSYDLYQGSVVHFQSKNFSKAKAGFEQILAKYPSDIASKRFAAISEEYIQTPPDENWDGVYTFKEK
jgi:adenylate cyclase